MNTRHLVPSACAAILAGLATAQGDPQSAGLSREAMWRAPTAEEWKLPVRIQWQRTWDDALAVARETGKAILVCVNMDGEIASEHYAGVRYRQPEIAALYEPYVCVIASVYRHNPRDHDEEGRRIECPRFHGVTCGEHIAIEPILYEKFMDGRRIAPRHIMVELDGKETYDVFYAWDTASVFQQIREGIGKREHKPVPVVRGDRSILERVQSPDSRDRVAVEAAFVQGDAAARRSLLEAAQAMGADAPVELLRLGVFSFDRELSQSARRALSRSRSEGAVDLISDSLRVPMAGAERETLIAALARLGETSPRARTLAVVHRGLSGEAGAVDAQGWQQAMQGGATYAPAGDREAALSRVERSVEASRARPDDAKTRLELAEATLAEALDPATGQALRADPRTAPKFHRLMYEDAHRAALDAERMGASGYRVDACVAVAAYHLGDLEAAYRRAEAAAGARPEDAQSLCAMAVLAIFAEARQVAIARCLREKKDWPPQWLSDVNAAYAVLSKHPFGTATHVMWHYDFLQALGAGGEATRVLDEGVRRFPDAWVLHDRLRARLLEEKGAAGLEAAYAAMLEAADAPPQTAWYAGYASLVAAEFHRRKRDFDQALAAYDRGIARYERGIERDPEQRAGADHYVAMAIGGKARIRLERGDLEGALGEVEASFGRRPDAAGALDGLNISTVDTARMLLARLKAADQPDLVQRLEKALAALPPAALELPAYEREGGAPQRPRRRRG